MNNIEYYYYFGVYEENVGYDKNVKISMEDLKQKIVEEELDKYCQIEFYPKTLSQPDLVALLQEKDGFSVLMTGEKASGHKIKFKEIGYALNYMLAVLRFKKKHILENEVSENLKIK